MAAASVSEAHIAVSTRSLRWLIAESDLVVRGRSIITDVAVVHDGSEEKRRPVLRVEVLEVLKGPALEGKELRFAQHGHGVAEYAPGQEALFFLRDISKSRELGELGSSGTLKWYSTQEHDDNYVLRPKSREATLKAARRYVAIEKMPRPERTKALRRITLQLLASRDPRLATSALRDLALSRNASLIHEEDVPRLIELVHDDATPIGIRVGLLAELERRDLVLADAHWMRLLRSTRGSARLSVIRAAGAHPSAAVNAELTTLLTGPDLATASAAAIALGSPGNESAVAPLSEALASKHAELAMAAIRALGQVGSSEARAALTRAAASHENARVRRRAEAEVRRLQN